MSERKMAEGATYSFRGRTTGDTYAVIPANGEDPANLLYWSDTDEEWCGAASPEVADEIFRLVHERDRLMVIMAGALKSFAILGLGPGASGEDFTEAVQRAVEHRDALRALAARQHALLKAEETFYTETEPGPHCPTCCGIHDGDQQLHTDDCEREALLILAAGLLEEDS